MYTVAVTSQTPHSLACWRACKGSHFVISVPWLSQPLYFKVVKKLKSREPILLQLTSSLGPQRLLFPDLAGEALIKVVFPTAEREAWLGDTPRVAACTKRFALGKNKMGHLWPSFSQRWSSQIHHSRKVYVLKYLPGLTLSAPPATVESNGPRARGAKPSPRLPTRTTV